MGYDLGWDLAIFECISMIDKVVCKVCKKNMDAHRNQRGPRNSVEAMAGIKVDHDLFLCPNNKFEWHDKAKKILQEADRTASDTLSEMLRKEALNLVENNSKKMS